MSQHKFVIVDIQGVGDHYTDPQIHCIERGVQFGVGDLGQVGINRFLATHHCNVICKSLQLPDVHPSDTVSSQSTSSGTRSRAGSSAVGSSSLVGLTLPFPQEFVEAQSGRGEDIARFNTDRPEHWKSLTASKSVRLRQRIMTMCCWGARLYVGCFDGSVLVFDVSLDSKEPLETLKKHTGAVNALCCDSTGRLLISGANDSNVQVWQLPSVTGGTIRATKQLSGHMEDVLALACSETILCSGSK
jgi:WD40 repeat protein